MIQVTDRTPVSLRRARMPRAWLRPKTARGCAGPAQRHVMFNPQAPATRSLNTRVGVPAGPGGCLQGAAPESSSAARVVAGAVGWLPREVSGLLGKPGCRDALGEIRARLFQCAGTRLEAQVLVAGERCDGRVCSSRRAAQECIRGAQRSWAGCCIGPVKRWH